ncbi:MAG: trigger factor [Fimbriimonadaceae bacterium]
MQVTREDLNPCTVLLTVTLASEEVKDAFERSFRNAAKTVRLPGFRPGHAPRAMLEKVIDPAQLYDTTADHLIRTTLPKAISESQVEPDTTTRPSVDLKALNHEEGTGEYVAKVPLPAKVELGEYKGIPLEKAPEVVSEEEVEYQIDEFRQRRSTRTPITDRGVSDGDVAVLNIKIDGEGGDGRNFMTVVGQTFPQLDQAVLGMKVEDMKHLDLTFPVNFQETDWAGKPFKCTVTLNSASTLQMPALDEAFAQSLKTESVEDLKSKIRAQLTIAKAQMNREIMIENVMDQLLERSKVEVSDNSWEDIANRRLNETLEEQREAGKTMEEYAVENGMTLEGLVQAWREKAQLYIKRAFLIREVFVAENLSLTNEDLNRELVVMAEEYDVEPKAMAEMLQKNNALEELRFRSISRKVSDLILSEADIREPGAPKSAKSPKTSHAASAVKA